MSRASADEQAGPRPGWRSRYARRMVLLPALLTLCLATPKLWQGEFSVDTGWYSAIALQAWRAAGDGDWSKLWSLGGFGGAPPDGSWYFNKPPLAFWIHGLCLWIVGPNLVAARLPAVIAAVGAVVFTALAAARLSGRVVGTLTGVVLALTLEFTRHARAFSLDMWQACFLMAAVWCVAEAASRGRGPRLLWAGVPLGLALLTKPLVALLALPIFAAWLAWTGRARWVGWVAGAGGVACAIAAPWHLSMVALHGDAFTTQYFGREVVERAKGGLPNLNAEAMSPWYYVVEVVRGFWPWLLTVAAAGASAAVGGWGRLEPGRRASGVKLAALWLVVWFVLLSAFPDKRPRYLLPVYPAAAWLSALWLLRAAPAWARRARNAVARWGGPVVALGAAGIMAAPVVIDPVRSPEYAELFARMAAAGEGDLWMQGPEGARGARVYLATGRWPRVVHDHAGSPIAAPPSGALVLYHLEEPWRPGSGETVWFEGGRILVTRVERGTDR